MTISSIVLVAFIAVVGLVLTAFCIYCAVTESSGIAAVIGIVILVVTILGCFGVCWYQLNTESGKRAYKDQQSNLNGGITRTVQVYDVNGQLIKEYSGKFDVETDKETYVLFDDEDGKRHIVYFTTGTIVIDEK